ncbi:peroxidase-related enzyme [Lutibacter sp.]|uniref:peroxidase-related enzyme n=1 Tax=Lutibacter sp. TaxID=1925666 RepID=UPI0025BBDC57|nr:peroxidase-related enzyme [Lutibacter sp.]MCF6181142.1 peroxidase-related enzyme [Lutibacter sp.]
MPRIQVIPFEEATGRLKEIYDDLIKKRGKLADVHTIQSLRPESIVKHMDLYMEIMFKKSDLSRAEREMIAVVVSSGNNCEYCQIHHAAALNHYWKNDAKIAVLRKDYKKADLSEREFRLCEFAELLTINPGLAIKESNLFYYKKIVLIVFSVVFITKIGLKKDQFLVSW